MKEGKGQRTEEGAVERGMKAVASVVMREVEEGRESKRGDRVSKRLEDVGWELKRDRRRSRRNRKREMD